MVCIGAGANAATVRARTMSTRSTWPAPAKLNLFLHVLGRRPDGYHQLQTVFQFLDYCDELHIELRNDGRILRTGGPEGLPAEQDLCVRAALALQAETGCALGADLQLCKKIPLGAGLGGGSSDAATTLVALNALWKTGLDDRQLAAIGLGLGADVPVFVQGRAAWAEGVGELLTPVQLPEPVYAVLVPPVLVSTAEIFSAPELQRNTAAISFADFCAGAGHNDCAPVTMARHPSVALACETLARHAPARMSGTGAAVFAAFPTAVAAQAAIEKCPPEWRGFVAKGLNLSPLAAIIRAA